jgi:4-hydroxy-tetrahydrodipicolinate reductase
MKIALLGYGKMGKAIEAIAIERGHSIAYKTSRAFDVEDIKSADVAIEFSVPQSAVSNIKKCFAVDVPVVVGTTGWYDQFEEVNKDCLDAGNSLLYATNFSVGVNVFWEINKKLAALMNNQQEYNVSMKEIHHVHKLDSPSGTAITTAEQIIDGLDRKASWIEGEAKSNELEIVAERENEVPGTHIVSYESEIDKIELSHEAKGRKGFALGAVLAAEWILEKRGVFTMKDMLKF